MANPNIIASTAITGNTVMLTPSDTNPTVLLSNAAASGKVYRISFISAANVDVSNRTATVSINSAAAGGGTAYKLAHQITVPANSTLLVTDKANTLYLMEDQSIVVTSSSGSTIHYVCSYEEVA